MRNASVCARRIGTERTAGLRKADTVSVRRCVPFYKPKWKYEKDLKAHDQRLCELPKDVQLGISAKYYNGKAPWLEEFE
jgi:hypothetical protein